MLGPALLIREALLVALRAAILGVLRKPVLNRVHRLPHDLGGGQDRKRCGWQQGLALALDELCLDKPRRACVDRGQTCQPSGWRLRKLGLTSGGVGCGGRTAAEHAVGNRRPAFRGGRGRWWRWRFGGRPRGSGDGVGGDFHENSL